MVERSQENIYDLVGYILSGSPFIPDNSHHLLCQAWPRPPHLVSGLSGLSLHVAMSSLGRTLFDLFLIHCITNQN